MNVYTRSGKDCDNDSGNENGNGNVSDKNTKDSQKQEVKKCKLQQQSSSCHAMIIITLDKVFVRVRAIVLGIAKVMTTVMVKRT